MTIVTSCSISYCDCFIEILALWLWNWWCYTLEYPNLDLSILYLQEAGYLFIWKQWLLFSTISMVRLASRNSMTIFLPAVILLGRCLDALVPADKYLLLRSWYLIFAWVCFSYQASKDDIAVYGALNAALSSDYINVTRWYNHIEALLKLWYVLCLGFVQSGCIDHRLLLTYVMWSVVSLRKATVWRLNHLRRPHAPVLLMARWHLNFK